MVSDNVLNIKVGRSVEDMVNTCPSTFTPRPDQVPVIPLVVTVTRKSLRLASALSINNSDSVGAFTLFHTVSSHPAVMIIVDINATTDRCVQIIFANDFMLSTYRDSFRESIKIPSIFPCLF